MASSIALHRPADSITRAPAGWKAGASSERDRASKPTTYPAASGEEGCILSGGSHLWEASDVEGAGDRSRLRGSRESARAGVRGVPLDVAGRKVLLKPNILGPFTPESHVNTSPVLVRALVDRLKSAGAEVTVGDNPGARGYGAVEKSGEVSGVKEASLGTFANISTPVRTVELARHGGTVNVSSAVLDADVLISVPKFKTHVLTEISGAIKNSYGFIVGGEKTRLHRDFSDARVFSQVVVEVFE